MAIHFDLTMSLIRSGSARIGIIGLSDVGFRTEGTRAWRVQAG